MMAALRAVLSAFFGVRGRGEAEKHKLSPGTLIAAGLICALVLVLLVLLLVRTLVASQGG